MREPRAYRIAQKRASERVQAYLAELLDRAAAAEWGLLLVAPFVGSFLGLVIRRLPKGLPIAWSRSRCPWCEEPLRPRDLMPIFSWLTARRRCRFCGHRLGWFYPGVELAAVAVALAAIAVDGGAGAWLDCVLGWWLLTLGWIDARCWLLPDRLVMPLILAGLAAAVAFDPEQLTGRALGAALGYLSLADDRGALPGFSRSRGVGPRRRQAAGRLRRLGRGRRIAPGRPSCRALGACRCGRPAPCRHPPRCPLGLCPSARSWRSPLGSCGSSVLLANRGTG